MKRHLCCACFITAALAPGGVGGPVDGQFAAPKQQIRAAGAEPAAIDFKVKYQGGQRACVWVRGDHQPIVPLDIIVYDSSGAEVVRDEATHDFAAVFWVPPRTAEYRIVIRNRGRDEFKGYAEHEKYTDVYVVFK